MCQGREEERKEGIEIFTFGFLTFRKASVILGVDFSIEQQIVFVSAMHFFALAFMKLLLYLTCTYVQAAILNMTHPYLRSTNILLDDL